MISYFCRLKESLNDWPKEMILCCSCLLWWQIKRHSCKQPPLLKTFLELKRFVNNPWKQSMIYIGLGSLILESFCTLHPCTNSLVNWENHPSWQPHSKFKQFSDGLQRQHHIESLTILQANYARDTGDPWVMTIHSASLRSYNSTEQRDLRPTLRVPSI